MDSKQLWDACLGELELTLTKANFTTWFKNTFILEYNSHGVVVGVPNAFTKTWMENKYHPKILKSLQHITEGGIKQVAFKVAPISKREVVVAPEPVKPTTEAAQVKSAPSRPATTPPAAAAPIRVKPVAVPPTNPELNPRHTFETFVVGKKTELAYAACRAVSENPATIYNPLFIYGGVGLGKTHLMQAVGNAIMHKFAGKRVLYAPCETFTNEYIKSVTMGQADSFKNKYRSVDVLLVDDIQFLAGKEGTQEAFFHTFNFLHQNNKQIVISSDRPPKAIPTLEDRMVSRFEWGMIVDVGAPDLETRIAILNTKCQEKNIQLEDDIIQFIATIVQNNIRELEGALNRVVAAKQLTNTRPTIESVKGLLSSLVQAPKRGAMTAKQVLLAVAEYYNVPVESITGSSRKKELVFPRQIAMYIMREEMTASYPTIGQELGGRDHTTAMHAFNKIQKDLVVNEKLSQDVVLIKQKLYL
ncbi:MAG: chromosomal replication initiator protein DnaA [Candidatus Kerfeldbacteria bacterium]|nr:chromosomal replication initiator protein DnaA [Candidatus Kerfeldbacteria bacterium]